MLGTKDARISQHQGLAAEIDKLREQNNALYEQMRAKEELLVQAERDKAALTDEYGVARA